MFKTKLLTPLIFTAFFLCSCISEKKAQRIANDFFNRNPDAFAQNCADRFPVKVEYKEGKTEFLPGDTITIKGDSLPCPEIDLPAAPGQPAQRIPGGKVKCPDSRIIRDTIRRVDTVLQENTAQAAALGYRLEDANKKLAIITAERDDYKEKANGRFWWIIVLIGGIGIGFVLRIKKVI